MFRLLGVDVLTVDPDVVVAVAPGLFMLEAEPERGYVG